jgi:hypothetical protein
MTMLDVFAVLVGAGLGWAAGTLKAQLHSLHRPQGALQAGDECCRDLRAPLAPARLVRFAARQEGVPKHSQDDPAEARTRPVALDAGRH